MAKTWQARRDMTILDKDDNTIAAVEIKAMSAINEDVIQNLYEQLKNTALARGVEYFFILSQKVGGIWKQTPFTVEDNDKNDVQTQVLFETSTILSHYTHANFSDQVNDLQLLVVFSNWLSDILYNHVNISVLPAPLQGSELFRSFREKVVNGSIELQNVE